MYNKRIKPQQKGGEALKGAKEFLRYHERRNQSEICEFFSGREARHRFSFR
jgi:hypothetical protein